jgi:dTDP-3-amino-3,4,6-trideoxy-alpha-D-glucose transaminase
MSSATRARVPFVDLAPLHEPLAQDLLADFGRLIETNAYANGPAVAEFERAFADYVGVDHCVGVASGLDAIRLALQALDIGPGDEVIVPAATFIATFAAVTQVGATPVPVDVSEADYGLDPAAADAAVTRQTRALLPVHLYGQVADLGALEPLARRHDLGLVEDSAQAHGARRDGRDAGSIGDAAAFSFYPGKNLGAMGDAGAVATRSEAVARRVRALREHGEVEKYRSAEVGWTSRLDTIQALVLLRKLAHLDEWNALRRAAAAAYLERLDGVGDLRLPPVAPGSEPVWHLFVVRTGDPAALAALLRDRGIATGRHYPEPPHLSQAYAALGHRPGAFPVTEALSRGCLSLPLFPGISEEQIDAVVGAIGDHFERG